MPITGSTRGKSYARLHLMRLGATRLDYYQPWFKVLVNGVDQTSKIRIDNASIEVNQGGTPNTAAFRVSGITPVKGQAIRVYMGDSDTAHCLFAGHILSVKTIYEGELATNVAYDLRCIDYTWRLNDKQVLTQFTNASASTIVTTLMATYASGFTTTHVVAGLATLDEITFTNEDLTDALDRIAARIGGYWYVDAAMDLHFYVTETAGSAQSVTDSDPKTWNGISQDVDLSQARTRAIVRGGGSNASADVAVGTTTLPVESSEWYSSSGGYVEVGPQRITYTSFSSLEGQGCVTSGVPGSAPSGLSPVALNNTAITVQASATKTTSGSGSDIASDDSAVLTLDVSAASGSSPSLTVTVETSASSGGPWTSAGSFTAKTGTGSERKVFTGLNARVRVSWTITGTTPSFTFSVSGNKHHSTSDGFYYAGSLGVGTYGYAVSYVTAAGEGDLSATANVTIANVTPGGSATLTPTTGGSMALGTYNYYLTYGTVAGETTVTLLGSTTLTGSQTAVSLASIATSADLRVTKRKIYRSSFGTGGVAELVTTINDNTTATYTDTTADASLGATAPTSNTAGTGQVVLTAIAVGAAGTTSRKVYRTVVNGSALQLLTTLSDNTTTTYPDNTADGSLGAAATGSSLGASPGQTTLRLTDLSMVPDGGWLRVDSQVISYTARASTSGAGNVTGIPASGAGSITAQIPAGTAVTVEPHLTGIASSGAGSILYAITSGDQVNLRIERNDTTAQTNLAGFLGTGDGIVEEFISDGRISITEATNRGDAALSDHKDPLVTVTGSTRDQTVRPGRTVTFTVTNPPISGTFKIQRVTLSEIAIAGGTTNYTFPKRQVDATSKRFSLEDLLRQVRSATRT